MEEQREFGGSYQFPIDASTSLEDFIDEKLAELDFSILADKVTDTLDIKLRQQERKTREVNQIFSQCENQLKQFKYNIEMGQGIVDRPGGATGGSDSDDDVQFVQAGFDPQLAARHKQQRQHVQHQRQHGQPRNNVPPTMQKSFTMVGGNLIQTSPHQASGSGRPHPLVRSPDPRYPNAQPTTPRHPASGFPTPQTTAPRALTHKPHQGGNRASAASEGVGQMQPRRPLTTMYAPPTKHADLVVGMKLYGKKVNDIWFRGTLTEIHYKEKQRSEWRYRIKFDGKGVKVLQGREIAFIESPTETLPVGSRVVALYKDEDASVNTAHYAGIVSESPSLRNSQRYLIFFDDGYAQYCASKEIHKVYEQSRNVWEDIHPESSEFIKSYLKQYPERPMVRLQSDQIIKTEWNGRWWTARVLRTDASLVKMYFDADQRVEWIYRGSTRLEPLYTELANAEMSKASGKSHRRHNIGIKSNKKPIVEYLRGTDEDFMKRKQMPMNKIKPQGSPMMHRSLSADSLTGTKKRSVARKSTSKLQADVIDRPYERRHHFQASSLSRNSMNSRDMIQDRLTSEYRAELNEGEALGERMEIETEMRDQIRKQYEMHSCNTRCLDGTERDPVKFRGYNPLIIPMLCGWERQISRQKNSGKRAVFYRGPCARRMRSLAETERYLKETDTELTIDLFCFDVMLHTHSEFVPIRTFCDIKDLSYGKETVRISCVNGIDRQYPDYVEYSNQRIPAEGVHLNLDPEFLTGCDCTENCGDPETCSCARLTLEASNSIPGPKPEILGYQYRRLKEPITSGIYECNQRCKCSLRCGNRVAQNGLQLRLQVFKTEKRGWGLRSLDDIPAGGFICVYAGQLLTEQGANEDGQQYGDEYLAELDYIEVVERSKEGYESEVDINIDEGIERDQSESEEEEEDYNAPSDSDSTFSGEKYVPNTNATGTPERKSRRKPKKPEAANGKESDEKRSTKIVIKRDADQDKSWSVKVRSPQAKTKEWVDSIPDPPAPMTIVISDEDESGEKKPDTEKTNTKTEAETKTESPDHDSLEASGSGAAKEEKDQEKKEVDIKDKGLAGAGKQAENTRDSDLDSNGEQKLEKPKKPTPSKVTLKLKSNLYGSDEIKVDEDKDTRAKEEETTSTNEFPEPKSAPTEEEPKKTENIESSDSSLDGSKKKEKSKKSKEGKTSEGVSDSKDSKETSGNESNGDKAKRQTKGRLSRFSDLPDPKSQHIISPIKIKLLKDGNAAENRVDPTPSKKKEKKKAEEEEEEDHGFKTRLFYNNEEFCYVMDAKSNGNIGRYLNHSCAPNVFVQNVFVDTHDMRFPWVAFFAGQYIRAGTELTWDYNYEVGSVPGKVLYCYCGAAECRGRLL